MTNAHWNMHINIFCIRVYWLLSSMFITNLFNISIFFFTKKHSMSRLFFANWVNNIPVDGLAPYITRSAAAIMLCRKGWFLNSLRGGNKNPHPFNFEDVKNNINANAYQYFFKTIHHAKCYSLMHRKYRDDQCSLEHITLHQSNNT